ncbi:MAG: hypothetical protein GC188_08980, partial [Alphaproteobacteria bacterium]|nr:hypothetical protein [Alphaproteobacteria bacterium]
MDKPILPEEQRNPEDASGQQPAHENPAQGVGAYAAHSSYGPADLTAESWEKSKRPWNATPEGRLAIRLFSRGIMGAAFFTAGGMLNRKLMHDTGVHGMHYEEGYTAGKYDATKPFSEQDNPLKFIAKMIDTFVGKPIELTVHAVTGSEATAKNAVRFRPTKFKNFEYSTYEAARVAGKPVPDLYRGRSLGNEIVNVTFDFFCASIGDAFGRDIAGLVDPNVKKKWVKDGHVDVPEALKTMMKTTWRYVSYNGGEDWAVALPYVYFMKGQRHVIDKISPGFAYDFDRGLNGGSFKIDKQGNVIGNYNIEGMIDLQNRFTVYNMGTLAYREAYDFVDRKLKGKHAVLYGSPDKDTTNQTLTEKASNIVKWLARSVVKGGIFMTPAVPFFWITRTPQTKYRGLFIHTDEHGRAMTLNYENQATLKRVEGWRAARATGKAPQGEEPFRKYENVYANEFRPPDYSSNEATGFTR